MAEGDQAHPGSPAAGTEPFPPATSTILPPHHWAEVAQVREVESAHEN